MAFVLDCSVTLAWLLPDESGGATDTLADELERTSAVAPAIWPYEVANALLVAQRRARIGNDDLVRVRRALAALPIEVEPVTSGHILSAVFDLGRRLDITSYDAAYVELAARRRLPLATLDERLRKACAALKIVALP
ncbi:MAG: type II toxin-antitoxin system VapC family toxin [Pseudomonadota bacterium]|nr:type II toxin-antitoxin system VapC family toxin [Pseudomonadota bacterium]